MKKNRPAVMLSALCRPADVSPLLKMILTETTTLGVRQYTAQRVSLPRTIETIETRFGPIHVKVARWGEINRAMPEYEDCRRAAEHYHVPLADVIAAGREAARQRNHE